MVSIPGWPSASTYLPGCGLVEKMTQQCIFEIFGWVSLTGEGCVSCSLTLWVYAWWEMCYCLWWLIFYPVQNSLCFNVSYAELSTSWYQSVASSYQLLLELQLGCPHLPWTSYLTVCGVTQATLFLTSRGSHHARVSGQPMNMQWVMDLICSFCQVLLPYEVQVSDSLGCLTLPGFPLDALIGPDSNVTVWLALLFQVRVSPFLEQGTCYMSERA